MITGLGNDLVLLILAFYWNVQNDEIIKKDQKPKDLVQKCLRLTL